MTPLQGKILRLIRDQGPISVAQYMRMALGDPEYGYYRTRDPLGRDFITAPEVSQIFGELIGLFFVQAWEDRGRPKKFHLVELGPGRGTLMADILRAARIRPAFAEAAKIILIETSPALRAIQEQTLKELNVRWAHSLDGLDGDAPVFAVANEFFDALPVRQCVKSGNIWRERVVIAEGDALGFGLGPETADAGIIPPRFRGAPDGSVFEIGSDAQAEMRRLTERIVYSHGSGLVIDYGHAWSSLGDTFQAMKAHRFADPLAEPGEADLTFHVDFAALSDVARKTGARVFGPVTQKAFLETLGIGARAARLKQSAPEQAAEIDAAIERLTGENQMGALFKAMAITDASSPALPGFPC